MNDVIGGMLPSALAIALSPVPVIAVILLVRSPGGARTSAAFLVGWLLGIIAGVVAFTALESIIPTADPDATAVIFGIVAIVLGVLLVFLAAGQLRTRPGEGEEATLPGWMNAISDVTVVRAGVLGLLFAVARPKNLLLLIAGGLIIGVAGLEIWLLVITIAIFVLVASSTVLVPVVAYLLAPQKMAAPLETIHRWLVAHNSAILAAVMFIVGVVLIGNGIAAF